MENHF
jgi:multidrug efflux pump subunit AcrA (membrane-fusion protein)